MNPLDLPSRKIPKEPEKPKSNPVPQFIGVQNERVREEAHSKQHITIATQGIKGVANNEFKIAYVEGQTLGRYLSALKLKRTGIYHAVYDETNPSNGRCRMTYVPQAGARIKIGSAAVGSATHLQRSNHDAQRLAARMGGGAKVVEVKK